MTTGPDRLSGLLGSWQPQKDSGVSFLVGPAPEAPQSGQIRGTEPRDPRKPGIPAQKPEQGQELEFPYQQNLPTWAGAGGEPSSEAWVGAACAGTGGGSGASLGAGAREASRWGPGRTPPPRAFLVGPQPPSPGPSTEPERDWWWRLSLGGGRAGLLCRFPCRRCRRRRPASCAGRSDRQGSRSLAMGSGAAAYPGSGKVSQTCASGRAAAGHPQRRELQTWAPRLHSHRTRFWRTSRLKCSPKRARGCDRWAVPGAHQGGAPGSSIWRWESRMVCTRKTKTLVSTCVILSGMTNIICLLYVGWVTNYIASVYVRGQEPAPDKKLEEDKGDTLKIIERLDHLENVIKQHIQGTGAAGNLGRPRDPGVPIPRWVFGVSAHQSRECRALGSQTLVGWGSGSC
ncbi:Hypothetical predicted protein [Marmota monax]|uniref:Polypeptide N-acetylgalactosaminyltransferase 18 n=1 Tax=Marmota monax TaxID=9995 RepID=A0A5E4A8F1_MARMO|nr:Hypothetical predicted protein [Marmota monax]